MRPGTTAAPSTSMLVPSQTKPVPLISMPGSDRGVDVERRDGGNDEESHAAMARNSDLLVRVRTCGHRHLEGRGRAGADAALDGHRRLLALTSRRPLDQAERGCISGRESLLGQCERSPWDGDHDRLADVRRGHRGEGRTSHGGRRRERHAGNDIDLPRALERRSESRRGSHNDWLGRRGARRRIPRAITRQPDEGSGWCRWSRSPTRSGSVGWPSPSRTA